MRLLIKLIKILVVSALSGLGALFVALLALKAVPKPRQHLALNLHLKEVPFNEVPVYSALIRLHDKEGKFFCSGFVIDAAYAVTAAHCLDDGMGYLRDEKIQIKDSDGNLLTGAKPAGLNNRLDYGIIRGDFRNFQHYELDSKISFYTPNLGMKKEELKIKDKTATKIRFKACGYPAGQMDIHCSSFLPRAPIYFQVIGAGQAFPGMSGGPVFDIQTNKVVGVVSAMYNSEMVITPVIGLLGDFGVE